MLSFSETDQFVKKSTIGFSSLQLPDIIKEFNQEDKPDEQRPPILKNINFFSISLFKHRILAKDEVRLVQRNGVPELARHSGKYQRRKKSWSLWKPWTWFRMFRDDSFTIGIYKLSDINTQGYIGYGDRHLVSVNQGEYAKVIIDGKPILLDEGAHIIKTNNFSYAGKVKQSESFIKHENLYRLQVPSAKIAAFLTDNQPYLVDAGTHYIRSNNFNLVKPQNRNQLFHNSADPDIQCGSLLRLMPKTNTVAVYYQNGEQKIFPDDNEKSGSREKVINDANVNFSISLSTNLINRHYPSASRTAQFEYFTKDSVKVGVRLFVCYRISDPKLALQNLDPTEIDKHIEYVTHVDMAVAGQETSLQGIQKSQNLTKSSTNTNTENDPAALPPSYNEAISTWQNLVEKKLKTDLKGYGIDLVRLNIEEIKILDKEVEKKISEQSYRVAAVSADLAAVDMEKQIAEKRANTEASIRKITAQTQKEVAAIEGEAQIIAAEARKTSLMLEGEALTNNPALLQLQLAEIQAKALKPTDKVISVGRGDNSSLLGLIAGSGLFNLAPTLPAPTQQFSNTPNLHTM